MSSRVKKKKLTLFSQLWTASSQSSKSLYVESQTNHPILMLLRMDIARHNWYDGIGLCAHNIGIILGLTPIIETR